MSYTVTVRNILHKIRKMLGFGYKDLYSELSPDGGVPGTTGIGTWLEMAPLGLFFIAPSATRERRRV